MSKSTGNLVSNCCEADLNVSDGFCEKHYFCEECGQPCDAITQEPVITGMPDKFHGGNKGINGGSTGSNGG